MKNEVFRERVNKSIEWLMEYIMSDDEHSINCEEIYKRYIDELLNLVERYCQDDKSPFKENHNGEIDFQKVFMYFENVDEAANNIDLSRFNIKTHSIDFSNKSLNLLQSRVILHSMYKGLMDRFSEIKSPTNDDLMRKLITAHSIKILGNFYKRSQFTFGGERFVTDGIVQENGTVKAVPYLESESLSDIGAIRLLEKILTQIKEKGPSQEKVIKIAIFGKLSNVENEVETLEDVLEKLLGEHWKIDITSFHLKKNSPFEIIVESDNKKIEGNLLEKDFYIKDCQDFDIMVLLDTGYLRIDTHQFKDAHGEYPYGAAKNGLGGLKPLVKADELIGDKMYRSYADVYLAILKCIEKRFYGQEHSFEFNPKLFFNLREISKELGLRPLYIFSSHDSIALKTNEFSCLKGTTTEELFGVSIVNIYYWGDYGEVTKEELKKRNEDIFRNDYSDISIIPISLWTLLKNAGSYFYSKGFVNLFRDEDVDDSQLKDETLDKDFITYAYNTTVYIDYSKFRDEKLSFGISYSTDTNNIYYKIAQLFVKNVMCVGLDSRCFGDNISDYLRGGLYRSMLENAYSLDHIYIMKKIVGKHYLIGNMTDDSAVHKLDNLANMIESRAMHNLRHGDVKLLKSEDDFLDKVDFRNCPKEYLEKICTDSICKDINRDKGEARVLSRGIYKKLMEFE